MQFNFICCGQIKKNPSIASSIHQATKKRWRIDRICRRLTFQFNHRREIALIVRPAPRHLFDRCPEADFGVYLPLLEAAPFDTPVAPALGVHPHCCGCPLLALNSVAVSHQRRHSPRSCSENPCFHRCEALPEAT